MRMAFGPVRAAARSSRGMLADEAERAFDAALSGPLPETIGRLVAEHGVVERVVAGMLEADDGGPSAERAERLAERLSSGETGRVMEAYAARLAQSDAVREALTEILSGPEVRRALTRQTTGYAAELAAASRHRARELDDAVEVKARRLARLAVIDRDGRFGGLASRGAGLVIDAALVQVGFTVLVGAIGLVAALAGGAHAGWVAGTLAGAGLAPDRVCLLRRLLERHGPDPGDAGHARAGRHGVRRLGVGAALARSLRRLDPRDRAALRGLPAGAVRPAAAGASGLPGGHGRGLRARGERGLGQAPAGEAFQPGLRNRQSH